MENLGEIPIHHFDEFLLLALSDKWLKIFKEPLKFTAVLKNDGKLHLVSVQSIPKKIMKKIS